jgi:hypothetical protein
MLFDLKKSGGKRMTAELVKINWKKLLSIAKLILVCPSVCWKMLKKSVSGSSDTPKQLPRNHTSKFSLIFSPNFNLKKLICIGQQKTAGRKISDFTWPQRNLKKLGIVFQQSG